MSPRGGAVSQLQSRILHIWINPDKFPVSPYKSTILPRTRKIMPATQKYLKIFLTQGQQRICSICFITQSIYLQFYLEGCHCNI